MSTLSETARTTQKAVKIIVIGIIAVIALRVSWVVVKGWWQATHPAPPPAPTVSFGILPRLTFPESKKSTKVVLETISGTTPELQDQGVVFAMESQGANLLALERAKEKARRLGFIAEPQMVSEEEYLWSNNSQLPETLRVNISNGNLTLKKDWQKDPTLLLEKSLPGKEEAILEAKSFLSQADLLTEDLREAEAKVTYLRASGSSFKTAPSLSEANFVRVDLFRSLRDDISFFTPNPEEGLIYLILSGSRTNYKRVVEVVYHHTNINYDRPATYPLKTSQQAWEELNKGEGFISSLDKEIQEVKVRKVSLGFYDSYPSQKFIQPIFVFEGDYSFKAYVPAVSAQWIEGGVESSATGD